MKSTLVSFESQFRRQWKLPDRIITFFDKLSYGCVHSPSEIIYIAKLNHYFFCDVHQLRQFYYADVSSSFKWQLTRIENLCLQAAFVLPANSKRGPLLFTQLMTNGVILSLSARNSVKNFWVTLALCVCDSRIAAKKAFLLHCAHEIFSNVCW